MENQVEWKKIVWYTLLLLTCAINFVCMCVPAQRNGTGVSDIRSNYNLVDVIIYCRRKNKFNGGEYFE